MINRSNITQSSEQYRKALTTCREVFQAAGRDFVEPAGVRDLMKEARRLYTELNDEAAATKEVEHARVWLIGIAMKFLRGAVEFFEDRVTELSYMSLDRDIMENMEARMREYTEAVRLEQGSTFELRLAAYRKLATVVNSALDEQRQRIEHRENRAAEAVSNKERERRVRQRQQEELDAETAKQRQEAAEADARVQRERKFAELFADV